MPFLHIVIYLYPFNSDANECGSEMVIFYSTPSNFPNCKTVTDIAQNKICICISYIHNMRQVKITLALKWVCVKLYKPWLIFMIEKHLISSSMNYMLINIYSSVKQMGFTRFNMSSE